MNTDIKMAGKPGMFVRTLSPARAEEIREKIRATLIVKALEDHVLEAKEMTPSQVSAALGLLKKSVPDLGAITLSGPDGGPVETVTRFKLADLG